MPYRIKITDQDIRTRDTQWEVGQWVETDGIRDRLCNDSWLHCFTSLLLAGYLRRYCGYPGNARYWLCEVNGKCLIDGTFKEGWTRMRLVREVKRPYIDDRMARAFGIQCIRALGARTELCNMWLSGQFVEARDYAKDVLDYWDWDGKLSRLICDNGNMLGLAAVAAEAANCCGQPVDLRAFAYKSTEYRRTP